MGWLVDSSSVSIVITYLLVSAVFIVLRRREPQMERPLRVGGRSAAGGIAVGVAAVITTACLLALYVPGMPAMLDVQPYVILGLWWLLGVVFLVRVPGGVAPGEDAEERLLDVQWSTPHLASLGVVEVDRDDYLCRLETALALPQPAL